MAQCSLENTLTIVEETANGMRLISASQAFRKYSWLKDAVGTNSSGNLRGMVISGKWNTVYKVSGSIGKAAQNAAVMIKFYEETQRSRLEMERIFMSDAPWEIKSAKISAQVSGICIRTLTSVVTGGVKTINWVLRKTKSINAIYWLDKAMGQNQFEKSIDAVDGYADQATVWVDRKTLGNGIYYIIEAKFR